ncbi:unnamed protein product [Acanthosepion pharaonis]|uniref:Endonuclease/exonuclease/phosphatase domain-containing protein n=1 Tax=Acanthosepion pharaonis TaxID=158019 RepID=A0A812E5W3_ACAPH|nr:unnamed protein product [Sepia pharaonis]
MTHHVACWNALTLKLEETQALTVHALHQYKVDVACLSEVKLADHGHKSIKVPLSDAAYHLYYSGPTDGSGRHGVALVLSDQANNALLAWELVSPCLARVHLRGALFNISIIAVYTPTLDADEVTKASFYDRLQAVMDGISPRDFVVIAGDFNARTGTVTPITDILSDHSLSVTAARTESG